MCDLISMRTCCTEIFSCTQEKKERFQVALKCAKETHQIFVSAKDTVKKLRRTAAKQLGVSFLKISIRFGGKILNDDSTSIADVGIISGSTIQWDSFNLRGGCGNSKFNMSDELREMLEKTPSGKHGKYSITSNGMSKLFPKLLLIARQEREFEGEDLTSHDCAALFQGKSWENGRWTAEKDVALQFHPMDKFPDLYSDKMPDAPISYPWKNFGLIRDLPQFLDACKKEVVDEFETTLWLDILFNCQNSPDIKLYLKIANGLYTGAELHFAFLFGGLLTRAWCISEIVTRYRSALTKSGLWKEGQDNTEAVIKGGELLREGHPAFTIFVTVQGRTDLFKDVVWGGVDRFGRMKAFDPEDLAEITSQILQIFGIAAALNFMLIVVRNAVISRYAALHLVRRPRPPPPSPRPVMETPPASFTYFSPQRNSLSTSIFLLPLPTRCVLSRAIGANGTRTLARTCTAIGPQPDTTSRHAPPHGMRSAAIALGRRMHKWVVTAWSPR